MGKKGVLSIVMHESEFVSPTWTWEKSAWGTWVKGHWVF